MKDGGPAGAPRLPRSVAAAGRAPTVAEWASTRRSYPDNLKVLLIAAIIALHGVLGYVGTDQLWSYGDVQEVTLAPATEVLLFLVAGPFAVFMIPLLFLVAGLMTPPSLERKGPGRFARDRLLRLGVPFLVYVLVLQPSLMYSLYHPLGAAPGSYREEFLDDENRLDTGPLWFVGVLLVFSLGYAVWRRVRGTRPVVDPPAITVVHLLVVVAAVTPLSFLVRLVYPFGSESGFSDLNVWEWPACLALFLLGASASSRGWLDGVPDRLRRQGRWVTLGTVVVMAGLVASVAVGGALDVEGGQLWGGWHWPALAFAGVEAVLAVFGSVWLLAEAQSHLDRRFRWAGPAVSRSAYAAFMLQGFVLIGLAVALRAVPLPAEVKALLVAGGGVFGSFALAWLLVTRVRAAARVL